MMGRTLRSNLKSSKLSPAKRKHSTSTANKEGDNNAESRSVNRSEVDRNVLEDQTNKTPSPPKRTRLRGKQAISESTRPSNSDNLISSSSSKVGDRKRNKYVEEMINKEEVPKKVEIGRTKRELPSLNGLQKTVNKNTKTTSKAPDAKDREVKVQDPPRVSARIRRTASLKENESEVLPSKIKDDEVTQGRPSRRVSKEEILSSIIESSDSEEEKKSEPSTPQKESENTTRKSQGFKVLTFYGSTKKKADSPVIGNVDKGIKTCVYKSDKGEEPLAIQPRSENERLALYEFEFDSSEEPKPKKKKRPARVKPKPAIKTKPKRAGKNVIKPSVVQHIIPPPLQVKKPVISAMKPAGPSSVPGKSVVATITVPSAPVFPIQTTTEVKPAVLKPITPVKSPRKSLLNQDLPPLMHLFDDDMEPPSPASATPTASPRSSKRVANELTKTAGPIRFEYKEIIKARERVIKTSLTPRAKPSTPSFHQELMDNTLPADESSHESYRLRQTSIRSFLNVQNDEGEGPVDDAGLFATGSRSAVEIVPTEEVKKKTTNISMVSSTPQRPGKICPPLQTFLSPVMASPLSRISPIKTRTSPRKAMGTPEKVQPVMEVPRRSPRKLKSPAKDSPLPVPTRLSLGTLRAAMKSNVPVGATAVPIANEEFPSLEETKNQPGSPQRNFRQPARKSYERRVRKAPKFMDLEEEDSDNEEEEEDEDLLFGDVAADEGVSTMKHHTTKHHKKPKDHKQEENLKELDEWASRFNSRLEEVEHFSLAVE